MSYEDIVISQSILPPVFYHLISIVFFFFLLYGKSLVTRKKNRMIFILYTLFVIFSASVQFALFTHGTKFAQGFLHINLNVDAYDSIWYGALFYALAYLFAMPRNIFVKYV
ncbi:hypothetical protein HQN64_03325 [Enterobacteriaceae bacterium BIT-l23]|uniref:hypothetical protein n=1 Tax=Jejubacter sp. L23 TaxID=3092086 RepID=UPI00158463F1|nr:hypothetical protein [Enterobacteriaceae bacterium BIT-l23]